MGAAAARRLAADGSRVVVLSSADKGEARIVATITCLAGEGAGDITGATQIL
jgi:NAD(P)-dependent dehydrogenase (short-subunit alcohol dehydrogenase family)